ncbi:MAG: DUF488 domain-containing protein [Nocardioidaceae bacterium]
MSRVHVKRIYDEPAEHDGTRVLVDRVWPRGVRKDEAPYDEWCKQVAPSTELRKWYSHDPAKYAEFAKRYRAELADGEPADALAHLRELADDDGLTLLTATKEPGRSQAQVLADELNT